MVEFLWGLVVLYQRIYLEVMNKNKIDGMWQFIYFYVFLCYFDLFRDFKYEFLKKCVIIVFKYYLNIEWFDISLVYVEECEVRLVLL